MTSFAACSCSVLWQKIAERYWMPISGPCLLGVVGLWFSKNTFTKSEYEISVGSNSICIASAWPVLSVQTSSYVGLSVWPPV